MDNIRPIRNEADYLWAVAEVDRYFDSPPRPGTSDADRFDLLSDLIEAFDIKHYPLPDADPIEIIKAHMEENSLRTLDLAHVIGQKSKASEILNRRRPLSLAMIQRISAAWDIPGDLLIKQYPLADVVQNGMRKAG